MNGSGLHHIHKRKRMNQKLKPYPNKNPWINFLDKLLLIVAIAGPIMSTPQILKIWLDKTSSGISVISFSLFAIFDIPWIIYGFIHKEKPILIAYFLWFIANLLIVIGAFLYP